MGFRIFASGRRGFHYEQDNCIDGDEFELIKVLAILQTMEYSATGAVGGVSDYLAPGITDLAVSLATMEALHNLKNAVSFLAMNPKSSKGWISVQAVEKNLLWADTARYDVYKFSPGDAPGAEFVATIGQSLKDTSMDNFGVLMQLSFALGKFYDHIGDSRTPRINIFLTK